MPTPAELYPLSTQDAKSIPLDIITPLGMIYVALTTSFAAIVIPAKYAVCSIFSSVDAYIDLTNTASTAPVSGTDNVSWLFIPANTVVITTLPAATVKMRSRAGTGDLHITGLQRWAALALPRQFNTKVS